jgi:hypothetical protein
MQDQSVPTEAAEVAQVVDHQHNAGWSGGPGECVAQCTCGLTFDGFDTLAEAQAQLDDHIEKASQKAAEPTLDGPVPSSPTSAELSGLSLATVRRAVRAPMSAPGLLGEAQVYATLAVAAANRELTDAQREHTAVVRESVELAGRYQAAIDNLASVDDGPLDPGPEPDEVTRDDVGTWLARWGTRESGLPIVWASLDGVTIDYNRLAGRGMSLSVAENLGDRLLSAVSDARRRIERGQQ